MSSPSEVLPSGAGWRHFAHVADMGVLGYGDTVEQAFEQAAAALTAIICEPEQVRAEQAVSVHCEASDIELLFVDWLNAVVYEMAVRRMLFGRFQIAIDGLALTATLWGEAIDRERHQPAVEVKGATYTELHVRQQADGRWLAQCVVDV